MNLSVVSLLQVPFWSVVTLAGLSWISGALAGYSLGQRRRRTAADPRGGGGRPSDGGLIAVAKAGTAKPTVASDGRRAPRKPRRRRRSSYYFSEDGRTWNDHRWRRRVGWASALIIVLGIATAGAVAMTNYKHRANAAAGYRN